MAAAADWEFMKKDYESASCNTTPLVGHVLTRVSKRTWLGGGYPTPFPSSADHSFPHLLERDVYIIPGIRFSYIFITGRNAVSGGNAEQLSIKVVRFCLWLSITTTVSRSLMRGHTSGRSLADNQSIISATSKEVDIYIWSRRFARLLITMALVA